MRTNALTFGFFSVSVSVSVSVSTRVVGFRVICAVLCCPILGFEGFSLVGRRDVGYRCRYSHFSFIPNLDWLVGRFYEREILKK